MDSTWALEGRSSRACSARFQPAVLTVGNIIGYGRYARMIEDFKYQVLDADGNLREMPDMVKLARVSELNAIIVLGTELKVPQSEVSAEGHYLPPIEVTA